jgi:CheY-like chemotaxis protein
MSAQRHILIVDDEPDIRDLLRRVLGGGRCAVETAGSGAEALTLLAADTFDLIVTDNLMPGMSGVVLAKEVKARFPALPVVMFSSNPPAEPEASLDLVLLKPEGLSDLIDRVSC